VEMRNEADALAFRTEKLLAENAETLPEDVKTPVDEALAKLKEALTGDDNDAVKTAMDDLNTKAAAMGQAVYEAAQAKQAAEAAQAPAEGEAASDDDVVDAEIVDEDGKDK
jgi:molecular chaperone DnaK